ncbi:SMC-Scp complex subunit ScpB [Moritella sp.]|uniref:SMC-Scp complex subunit ScpB n=1 Tax=Moritella sp. TaxID=78556 RepID=UPI001DBF83F2|nr:SMC-Scp complex subunit ScpB [Moritella sp.]MCJ8349148.1 SMC-Scp complex subunit ScpB [Moritella sp.]NQZ39436.1 SMC-Scp complex subunit ScpB [Moritella sp.]
MDQSVNTTPYKQIIEAAIFVAKKPLSLAALCRDVLADEDLSRQQVTAYIAEISADYHDKGIELVEVASGYRFQARSYLTPWLQRMLQDKPAKYSRATLETLALIAYRQPVSRGDIEAVRGVAVSSQTIHSLEEREWIKVIGRKEVPGRPALYATTTQFLDYFGIKSIQELPPLDEALLAKLAAMDEETLLDI